ncbi:hypothetical protein PITC_008410 [Penicillium italicum]|uniref:Uncharacterized protein n=1 Tax=Penicillium italicum TaxID=40296 RepID=A0A0A2LEE8_PENIT|nr:hypothetical protein PITC_008410 [Penicillium italicum]
MAVSKEVHKDHHQNYRSPELNRTADRVKLWKAYLQDWRVHIEKTDRLEDAFFGGSIGDYSNFLGLNLTLYHLLCLKLDANIRIWAQSPDGRQAVYHAAQLKRPAGLLTSAIILCTYSAKASEVNTYEGDGVMTVPAGAFELGQSNLVGTPEFENWICQGGPATVDGVCLHPFSVPRFSSWHRDRLETFPIYSSRLVAFLLTLKL